MVCKYSIEKGKKVTKGKGELKRGREELEERKEGMREARDACANLHTWTDIHNGKIWRKIYEQNRNSANH